jgi:hypothetical protein
MKFYERKFNHGMSNEETVNAVDLDSLLDNLGEVSVDNVKIAGIQVYFMGSEEGIYELFLEKSKNCVRRTEKFENHSGCGDELFDSLRQAQDVYYGSFYERCVKLFALLVKEIEKASAYKSGIPAWDSDAQIRAFVGYENDGEMKYLTTANAVITPIMLAVLKDFEYKGRGYDEYWRIWELADLTDTSDLEERNVELKYELDWNDDDEYEDDEWDDEEFEDEEDE